MDKYIIYVAFLQIIVISAFSAYCRINKKREMAELISVLFIGFGLLIMMLIAANGESNLTKSRENVEKISEIE